MINGKAIYEPKGKAGEYAKYSCNFYVGCSNGCTYCYLKKPPLNKACGGNVPTLKKCFKDENHAVGVFEKELKMNLLELQRHGLFFSFTTDPMFPSTINLTKRAILSAARADIYVKILTKLVEWVDNWIERMHTDWIKFISVGFTLTGHDELEPNASTNAERIAAMKKLHDAGFKTWASIEPVIDFESSWKMISQTLEFCDLYKIGLESGRKYDEVLLYKWVRLISRKFENKKFYFKDSLLRQAGYNREDLPYNCVGRDYDMFNN